MQEILRRDRGQPIGSFPSPLESDYMIKCDNINFTEKQLLPRLFEIFGWNLKECDECGTIAPVRADFYPVGYVLGFSKKAVIICDGESEFDYEGTTYFDFQDLYDELGDEAYATFPDWNIVIEKEWCVKKNGEWVASFSNISEMPFRTKVGC